MIPHTYPTPLAFVDLETTGATAHLDRITEIGIVEVDPDGSVREWQQLVNPGCPISPFIEQLTGISNAMVAEAPPFAAIADEVRRRLQGRLFFAHNAHFDYGFLKREFARLGITFRARAICTVKLSRALFPEYTKHNLDTLIERHGLQAEARHRALADAQLIHQFWQKIHVTRSAGEIDTALEAQQPVIRLPSQIDPAIAEALPEGPGVFLFLDGDERLLYLGKAGHLQRQVLALFAAAPKSTRDRELREKVRHIRWQETAGEIGARLLDAQLRQASPPLLQRPRRATMLKHAPHWPFSGAATLREGDVLHVIDRWCYRGSAANDSELFDLLLAERPPFDGEIYAIISKYANQLIPL